MANIYIYHSVCIRYWQYCEDVFLAVHIYSQVDLELGMNHNLDPSSLWALCILHTLTEGVLDELQYLIDWVIVALSAQ